MFLGRNEEEATKTVTEKKSDRFGGLELLFIHDRFDVSRRAVVVVGQDGNHEPNSAVRIRLSLFDFI